MTPVVSTILSFSFPHRRLLTILVIACRIVIPALSISFFESPDVTHTFSAG